MRRAVAILTGLALVGALPVMAQNTDVFREEAPPPAVAAPAPKAAPRPRPAPEPEPEAVAPPPSPAPPSPPAPRARHYVVTTQITTVGQGRNCFGPDFSVNVNGGQVDIPGRTKDGEHITLRGPINGKQFDLFSPDANGGARVRGTIDNGHVTYFDYLSAACHYHYP
jgi:hypothetical protein